MKEIGSLYGFFLANFIYFQLYHNIRKHYVRLDFYADGYMTHAVSVQGLNSGQESQPPQDTGSNSEVDHRVLGGNLMLQCLVKLIANCQFLTRCLD